MPFNLTISALPTNGGEQSGVFGVLINENVTSGTKIGKLVGFDSTSINYTIVAEQSYGDRFEVIKEGGEYYLAVKNGGSTLFDYEDPTFEAFFGEITFKFYNGSSLVHQAILDVELKDLAEGPANQAPTTPSGLATINEGAGAGTDVLTLADKDADGQTITYIFQSSLAGSNGLISSDGRYKIVNNKIVINNVTQVNADETVSYTLTANDNTGAPNATSTGDVTITVKNVVATNNAPVIANFSGTVDTADNAAAVSPFSNVTITDDSTSVTAVLTFTANQGALAGYSVGSVSGNTYTVTGTVSAVQAAIRALTFNPTDRAGDPVGHQQATVFTLSVSDGTNSTNSSANVTVNSIVANRAPTNVLFEGGQATASIAENGVARDVATLEATDSNSGDTFTYSFDATQTGGGNAGGKFAISGNKLKITGPLDYEDPNLLQDSGGKYYQVYVIARDQGGNGLSSPTKILKVYVTDVVENTPPVITGLTAGTQVVEDTGVIQPFSQVNISDSDQLTVVITMSNAANGEFAGFTSGAYNKQAGTFTVVGNAAFVTSVLQALRFDPKDNPTGAVGSGSKTTFTITATDSGNASTTNSATEVNATVANRAPTDITIDQSFVRENLEVGTIVGTLSAVDSNANETFTYTLVNNAGGRFSLSTAGGVTKIVTATNLDYESTDSLIQRDGSGTYYSIKVQVRDGSGATLPQDKVIKIYITNDTSDDGLGNQAPVITGFSGTSTIADTGSASPFAGVNISDAGQLTVKIILDASSKGVLENLGIGGYNPETGIYTVTGTAAQVTLAVQGLRFNPTDRPTDATGTQITTTFTISVTDSGDLTSGGGMAAYVISQAANRAPTDVTITNNEVRENLNPATEVGTLSAVDSNANEAFTYSLVDNAGGRFTLSTSNGVTKIVTAVRLDYEDSASLLSDEHGKYYVVKVQATDRGNAQLAQAKSIKIYVTNDTSDDPTGNQNPDILTFLNGSTQTSISENVAGATLGILVGHDPNPGDILTFAIAPGGDQSGKFEIVKEGQNYLLKLKSGVSLDYENSGVNHAHVVTVRVSDGNGGFKDQAFTIDVGDVNENTPPVNYAPTDIGASNLNIQELASDNSVVGILTAADANIAAGDSFRFDLIDSADGRFAIVGNELQVVNGVRLDYEQAQSHQIRVKVTDQGGLSFEKVLTVNVGDVAVEWTLGSIYNDVIKGGSGKDTIGGGLGDDKLWGGLGNDVLTGGLGKDTFVFNTKLAKTNKANKKYNLDKIVDFNVKDDTIWLDDAIFKDSDLKKLGKGKSELKPGKMKKDFFIIGDKALDANDHLIYNKKTGALYYDADGNGAKEAIQIASLKKNLKLTEKDFFMI
ncbi:cadherin domain-containing protein [Microvirga sp. 2MCAF38]|uniref:beta strand repeat-containing protein n=1 Tax=Microvirga sp. 2MCAF38 TaxID=3232989 RepID=UPI003F98988B